MHSALFSRFAPRCGELEEARRTVLAASVGTFSRQMVQHDGEIAQFGAFLWHGSLPFICFKQALASVGPTCFSPASPALAVRRLPARRDHALKPGKFGLQRLKPGVDRGHNPGTLLCRNLRVAEEVAPGNRIVGLQAFK